MAWPLLLSLAVLGLVGYYTFDPVAFRRLLPRLNPWLLGAAAATVVLRVFFGAWRLHYFSRGQLSLPESARSQLAWDFLAYVTPSTVGGGPFVALFIARDSRLPLGEATSVILFSMLVDQICFALTIPVLLLCSAYVEVFPEALGAVGYWSMVLFFFGFMLWVVAFGYGTLFRPQLLKRLARRLFSLKGLRRFRKRALSVAGDLEHRSRLLRSQPPRFYANGFVLSLIPWISRYLLTLFIIWSVYPSVDRVLAFLRAAALNLGALALPTPGGAGGVEGLYLLFFGPPLMPAALVAPTLLVWRLMSYYLFIIIGVFIVARHLQRATRRTLAAPSQKQRTGPKNAQPHDF